MKTIYLLLIFLTISLTTTLQAQTYVNANATGNNDGTSWANAYNTLHDALENYNPGDEIWVAAGTYLPEIPSAAPGFTEPSFYIHQDVLIYGGFEGTETALDQRNPDINVTILSGDLNGDDVVDDFETNREDNANNLVYIDTVATATIDGFTISGGHADGDTTQYYHDKGAAIFSWGVAELNNCTVEQNYTLALAAVFMEGAAAEGSKIENSVFQKNSAGSAGAVLALYLGGEGLTVTGCQFIENEAEFYAGALGLEANANISDCQFSQNTCGIAGGGVLIQSATTSDYEMTLTNCDFENNGSMTGGAFYYISIGIGDNNLSFNGCEFTGNTAISAEAGDLPDAGAMGFEYSNGNPTNDSISVVDCLFENNTSELRGGGIAFFNGNGADNFIEVINSTFSDNSSTNFGGGFYLLNYGGDHMEANITGCVFENNSSTDGGGVVFFSTNGEHNNFNVTSCDFTGNQATELSVGDTPDGGGIYINFQTPGDILQHNSITVEDCTLQGNSAEQRGGGIQVFNNIGNDNHVAVSNCQIFENTSGEGGGGLFVFNLGGTDFEVNVSETDFTDNSTNHGGAAYYFSNSGDNNKLLFSDCNFTDNTAITSPDFIYPDGGALGFQYGAGEITNDTIILTNCALNNNTAERLGGGIAFFNGAGTDNHLELNNCEIIGNAAGTTHEGGGMAVLEGGNNTSSVLVRNTHFSANTAEEVQGFFVMTWQGAAQPESRHVELLNCLFSDHNPNSSIAMVTAAQDAEFTLTNCTFADNECTAAGIYPFSTDTKLTLQNNILQSGSYPDFFIVPGGSATPVVQSLGGNIVGSNALDAYFNNTDQSSTDPLFEAGTFQLSQNSPAVDAGVLPDVLPLFDLAGNDRLQGGCIDIGAYESPHDAGTDCQEIVAVKEVLTDPSVMTISPNPVTDVAILSLENDWRGALSLRVVNTLGQEVQLISVDKYDEIAFYQLNVSVLPKGAYRILISDGEQMVVGAFIK